MSCGADPPGNPGISSPEHGDIYLYRRSVRPGGSYRGAALAQPGGKPESGSGPLFQPAGGKLPWTRSPRRDSHPGPVSEKQSPFPGSGLAVRFVRPGLSADRDPGGTARFFCRLYGGFPGGPGGPARTAFCFGRGASPQYISGAGGDRPGGSRFLLLLAALPGPS